jgi:hypothetical protein
VHGLVSVLPPWLELSSFGWWLALSSPNIS